MIGLILCWLGFHKYNYYTLHTGLIVSFDEKCLRCGKMIK